MPALPLTTAVTHCKQTGIYPINHLVVVKDELLNAHLLMGLAMESCVIRKQVSDFTGMSSGSRS